MGRPLNFIAGSGENKNELEAVGRMPEDMVEEQHGVLMNWHENQPDLVSNLRCYVHDKKINFNWNLSSKRVCMLNEKIILCIDLYG